MSRLAELILASLGPTAGAFVDDLTWASETVQDHLIDTENALLSILENGVKVKATKCEFAEEVLNVLGHTVDKKGIHIDQSKTAAIRDLPVPKNQKESKRIHGFFSYYRRFIKNFSKIVRPILEMSREGVKFIWSVECQEALDTLKRLMLADPILCYPDLNEPFLVFTDASDVALGAVLAQLVEEEQRPIAFASRTIQKHEAHWAVTEKEALAVVWAVKYFRTYLVGRKFKIITDHTSLRVLKQGDCMNARLQRWACFLQQFDFEVHYKPDRQHLNADLLSRIVLEPPDLTNKDLTDVSDNCVNLVVTNSAIEEAQISDKLLHALFLNLDDNIWPMDTVSFEFVRKYAPKCILDNGLVFYQPQVHSEPRWWVPSSLVDEILRSHHDCFGHFSVRKTIKLIEGKYFWPTLNKDVYAHCQECKDCQLEKVGKVQTNPPLQPLSIVGPFQRVVVDTVGPLSETDAGNKHIVVFTDWFTKFVIVIPVPDITAITIARVFIDYVVFKFGAPVELLSDRVPAFISQLFRAVCEVMNVTKRFSTAYSPQTNGIVDRFNQTLLNMIRCAGLEDRHNWDILLPYLQFAYNCTFHESTRRSPFYMVFGRHPVTPMDVSFNLPIVDVRPDISDYISGLRETLQLVWQSARDCIHVMQRCNRQAHDKNATDITFQIDDLVMLRNEQISPKLSQKLLPQFTGPYRVLKVDGLNVEIIKLDEKSPPQFVHMRRLNRFRSKVLPPLSEKRQPPHSPTNNMPDPAIIHDNFDVEYDEEYVVTDGMVLNVCNFNFRSIYFDLESSDDLYFNSNLNFFNYINCVMSDVDGGENPQAPPGEVVENVVADLVAQVEAPAIQTESEDVPSPTYSPLSDFESNTAGSSPTRGNDPLLQYIFVTPTGEHSSEGELLFIDLESPPETQQAICPCVFSDSNYDIAGFSDSNVEFSSFSDSSTNPPSPILLPPERLHFTPRSNFQTSSPFCFLQQTKQFLTPPASNFNNSDEELSCAVDNVVLPVTNSNCISGSSVLGSDYGFNNLYGLDSSDDESVARTERADSPDSDNTIRNQRVGPGPAVAMRSINAQIAAQENSASNEAGPSGNPNRHRGRMSVANDHTMRDLLAYAAESRAAFGDQLGVPQDSLSDIVVNVSNMNVDTDAEESIDGNVPMDDDDVEFVQAVAAPVMPLGPVAPIVFDQVVAPVNLVPGAAPVVSQAAPVRSAIVIPNIDQDIIASVHVLEDVDHAVDYPFQHLDDDPTVATAVQYIVIRPDYINDLMENVTRALDVITTNASGSTSFADLERQAHAEVRSNSFNAGPLINRAIDMLFIEHNALTHAIFHAAVSNIYSCETMRTNVRNIGRSRANRFFVEPNFTFRTITMEAVIVIGRLLDDDTRVWVEDDGSLRIQLMPRENENLMNPYRVGVEFEPSGEIAFIPENPGPSNVP